MFAQVVEMQVPAGRLDELRQMVTRIYLPAAYAQPGYVAANIVQPDEDTLKLIIYWESQKALREANHAYELVNASLTLACSMPGLRIHKRDCTARIHLSSDQLMAVG